MILKQILIIEDNEPDLYLMKSQLHDAERIVVIRTLAELKDQASRKDEFDAVLLDVMIPGATSWGLEGISLACERYPDIPKVVITSTADPEIAERVIELGAQDYLAKSEFWWERIPEVLKHAKHFLMLTATLGVSTGVIRA